MTRRPRLGLTRNEIKVRIFDALHPGADPVLGKVISERTGISTGIVTATIKHCMEGVTVGALFSTDSKGAPLKKYWLLSHV